MQNAAPRLFKSAFLEGLTHTDYRTPLILWLPFSAFLIWKALFLLELRMPQFITWSLIGFFSWTLVEYLLHRFVFHFSAKTERAKKIIYSLHGIHHEAPELESRLLMPALPAALYCLLFYQFFLVVLGEEKMTPFFAFFLLGYLCYGYTHYGIHFFKPRTALGRYLRKHHLQHHSSHQEAKFGVSSPLWDYLFRTLK